MALQVSYRLDTKYRFRVLEGEIRKELKACIHKFCEKRGTAVIELNVQVDHIHLITMIPPKVSISELLGRLKGRSAIGLLKNIQNYAYESTGATTSGHLVIVLIR